MYSDTHFHFDLLVNERKESGHEILSSMAKNKCFFAQDIGTCYNDLAERQQLVKNTVENISDISLRNDILNFVYFSAGIWPDPEEIKNRKERFPLFKKQIKAALHSSSPFFQKITAIGECGLDHHWNPSGVDGRCESDFDTEMLEGEKELFCMQLKLAKEMNLPVIIHSRDAAEETIECIKKIGYSNGVIHCFSYGKDMAKKFLDMGWYISFTGSVTYTKKSKMEEMEKLLQFIPEDRLLLETDAPYLAPVPFRGKSNTPLLVEYVYKFIANIRGVSVEQLSEIADNNVKELFF